MGNSWGEGVREETAPQHPGWAPSLLREWKGLFEKTVLSTPLAVSQQTPPQSSNSGDGLLCAPTFPREVGPGRLQVQAVTSQLHLHLSSQRRTKTHIII